MGIDDVLDLLILIAKEIPNPTLGDTNCDTCDNANLGYAINILRAINKEYLIARIKDE